MARSQQAVYLQTYLTDAITEEVRKHGSHNQKAHGKRKRGGGRDLSSEKYSAGGKYGMTGRFRLDPYSGTLSHVEVKLDKRERTARAAVGVGAAAVAGGLFVGSGATGSEGMALGSAVAVVAAIKPLSEAIRGVGLARMDSERGRSATSAHRPTQKAAPPAFNPKAIATLRTAYRRWLTATGKDDSAQAAETYARLVLAEAKSRKGN